MCCWHLRLCPLPRLDEVTKCTSWHAKKYANKVGMVWKWRPHVRRSAQLIPIHAGRCTKVLTNRIQMDVSLVPRPPFRCLHFSRFCSETLGSIAKYRCRNYSCPRDMPRLTHNSESPNRFSIDFNVLIETPWIAHTLLLRISDSFVLPTVHKQRLYRKALLVPVVSAINHGFHCSHQCR